MARQAGWHPHAVARTSSTDLPIPESNDTKQDRCSGDPTRRNAPVPSLGVDWHSPRRVSGGHMPAICNVGFGITPRL